MKGQIVGQRYRLKSLIGEGGMASVWAAVDEKLDREVAIKIMHPHLARNNDVRDRFLLEARTVSTLDHPNILKVYDFSGLHAEQLWIVTEILYGVDLAEYVKRFAKHRLHPLVCTLIVREICRALHEVHKLKIVHRDIKPENIMLLDSGQLKLMDFGIAKVHRANATQTGTFMGSPSYMSPEQIRGADVDIRADIYSLSVLFYEIITGVMPYSGQTTAEVINKIIQGQYTSPQTLVPDLPAPLVTIIARGLCNKKEERFRDIQEMASELDHFIESCGFNESRLELERFMTNRSAFERRLAKLSLSGPTEAGAGKNLNQTVKIEAGAKIDGGPSGQFPETQLSEPSLTQHKDRKQARDKERDKPRLDQEPLVKPAPRKIFIREHVSDEHRRGVAWSNYFLLFLLASIAFVFFWGGNRLNEKLNLGPPRSPNTIESSGQNKPRPMPENVAPVSKPGPQPDQSSNEVAADKPILIENQNVTLDEQNPPKVSKKEVTVIRPKPSARPKKTADHGTSQKPAESTSNKRPSDLAMVSNPATDASGTDDIAKEPEVRERGTLKIASAPAAEILIDGKLYGTTNERAISVDGLKLDPGNYQLKLRRKGYKSEEQPIVIRQGEMKQLNISLSKAVELIEFTVRSNRLPAQLVIEDLKKSGRRREIMLTRRVLVLNLKPGQYRVQVAFGGDQYSRVIELKESDKALTFSANFK